MFLAILLLSFVLLMLVFRSLLVPLKAVIMNLLSIGAAYGVIVAIFQWGWLKDVVGIGKEGPIEAWVPMMLFAIVFGLSMDYEVFLLSRIKEEYDRTHDNATAVAHGLAKTARLITAAAAIMICVFGSFVLSDLRVLKLDRLRARVRGVHRRDRRAPRARAGDDGAARRPQLVVPEAGSNGSRGFKWRANRTPWPRSLDRSNPSPAASAARAASSSARILLQTARSSQPTVAAFTAVQKSSITGGGAGDIGCPLGEHNPRHAASRVGAPGRAGTAVPAEAARQGRRAPCVGTAIPRPQLPTSPRKSR